MLIKFKSNIKCASCIEKVTGPLNKVAGEGNWEVDLSSPMRVLSLKSSPPEDLLRIELEKVGYKIERIET